MTATQADPVPLRALRALPDALLAAVFLWVWLDPVGWRHTLLAQGMLIIIFEFLLILSSIALLPIVFSYTEPRRQRLQWSIGLSLFYTLFVALAAWLFFLPLPQLGLTQSASHYGLPRLEPHRPQLVSGFVVMYFGLLALAKLRAWDVPGAEPGPHPGGFPDGNGRPGP